MKMLSSIRYGLLILATLWGTQLLAATTSVAPTAINYQVGSGSSISLLWTITTTGNGGGGATSRQGIFTSAPNVNSPIVVGGGTLSLATPSLGSASVSETVNIPPLVLTTAQTQSLDTIYYYRIFDNVAEGPTNAAFVQINLIRPTTPITPGGGALSSSTSVSELNLNRLALSFNDNSIVKLVKPKTYLNAVAQISYTGTGLLDAVWKIATPASTQGAQDAAQLIYIPLRTVRQYLGAGGRVILQSPKLPTDMPGNYVVTLTINPAAQTNINFNQPVILRYAVGVDGEELRARKQPPINVASPRDKALLDENTRFKWQPVAGARAYQLELYLPDRRRPMSSELSEQGYDESSIADQAPASGLLVPGKRTSLSLGELSKQHLRHGETYLWRIIAIGQDGSIISSSPIREIRIP